MAIKKRVGKDVRSGSTEAEDFATAPARSKAGVQDVKIPFVDPDASMPVTKGWGTKPPVSSTNTRAYRYVLVAVTIFSFWLRFRKLGHPNGVVFDEVHFGKFASYYLRGTYFFDLHPPFAKMMIAFVGWLVGYNGAFLFDTIGLRYETAGVPYLAYRGWCALQGALCIPVAFETMKHCGFSWPACLFGAMILCFDMMEVLDSRLILLDATLLLSIAFSIYFYVRFAKLRAKPFSRKWWRYLLLTGISLSCVLSTKYVGMFTFAMIGVPVVSDLWRMLDKRAGLTICRWNKHFGARALGLVAVPLSLYLFWFWVHFATLPNSGPGDNFMSPEFQKTLAANPATLEAMDIYYHDTVTIRNAVHTAFLHSHPEVYPLRYTDGRVSSNGQQVTGYTHEDVMNQWEILPLVEAEPGTMSARPVFNNEFIRLRHVATDTYLLAHDVASPSYRTNEEFTTVNRDLAFSSRAEDTLFQIQFTSLKSDGARTKLTRFRLKHKPTPVVMWMSERRLPDWGLNQLEINGNKNLEASGSEWIFDDVASVSAKETRRRAPEKDRMGGKTSFLAKWWELQLKMFAQNNALTTTHPYQSAPQHWPILRQGIAFWSDEESRSQIYYVGNYAGYFFELVAFALFVVIFAIDQVCARRKTYIMSRYARHKFYHTLGWLFLGWAIHYFPFFLMGRQLFLHHYMPAHYIGALLTAGIADLVCGELDEPQTGSPKHRSIRVLSTIGSGAVVFVFVYFWPVVYGTPLTVPEVLSRQWFKAILQYNK